MATNTHHHTLLSAFHCLLLLGLVCLCNVVGGSNSTWSRPGGCIDSEREALLQFKRGFPYDPANRLSSWTADGSDCCGWNGVSCDSMSGHVVKLDLRSPETFWKAPWIGFFKTYSNRSLGGEIGPSLLGLKYLAYLDLSYNDFKKNPIPEFMGSLSNLEYLNLSGANLQGRIPHHLGNLSRLQTLDLSNSERGLTMSGDARWVSQLSSLQHLNLYDVNISSQGSSGKLLVALNMLPSLSWVNLKSCELESIPSLPHVNLTSLSFLDLSSNSIQSPFPEWLTNITSLKHLDLSGNNFEGGIPSALWSMSSLNELIISGNERFDGKLPRNQSISLCKLQRLEMILMNISSDINELEGSFSGCIRSSLQVLDLGHNQLSGSFPSWLVEMKRLKGLSLSSNLLQGPIPASLGRLFSLEWLDLSDNNLNGSIPYNLGGLSMLTSLNLGSNHLQGMIPETLGNLSSLRSLNLGENILSGGIPKSLGRLPSLESLSLSHNNLGGPISAEILSNLSSLQELDLSYNHLGGMVSAAHLSNLKSLQRLSMANNPIIFNISSDWVLPFQLYYVDLSLCKVGPLFPTWLRLQQNVGYLNLSNSEISDAIPDSYWSSTFYINILDLSNNQITGRLLDSLKHIDFLSVDLASNRLEGAIPEDIGDVMSSLFFLSLSNNTLNGSIPTSLCRLRFLEVLDLSRNNFSGNVPNCWKLSPFALNVLNLAHNSLVGVIPNSLIFLFTLRSLQLNGNRLSGEFPLALRAFSSISTLDHGENKISGRIPIWLAESMPYLKVLRLRSNNFKGAIPPNLASLTQLQVLDLANNDLVGNIPHGFGNFTAMKFIHNINKTTFSIRTFVTNYDKEVVGVVTKGQMLEYQRLLSLVVSIDLSSNRLSGDIPQDLTDLVGLQNLNLSRNRLTGHIMNINKLHCLESLDLSSNNFFGEIPALMSSMTSLSHLNLSFNNFSGRIPRGNQFDTFIDASIYKGNPYLCGFPLDIPCEDGNKPEDRNNKGELEEHKNDNTIWIYVFTVLGFILGFWTVCGTLIMHNRWRIMFFIFIDDKFDQLYVFMILLMRRLKRFGKEM